MKILRYLLLGGALSSSLLYTQTTVYNNPETKTAIGIGITQGFRYDRVKWSVSAPRHVPNVLSELTYRHIHIYNTRLVTTITKDAFFGDLRLGYGRVFDGTVQDSDYLKSNRKGEFSRSYSDIDGDYVGTISLRVGKEYKASSKTTFIPLIGYMWEQEKLRSTHGRQTQIGKKKVHKRIRKLNSTSKNRWDAPFIGAKLAYDMCPTIRLTGEYNFIFPIQYHGYGHWNLRHLHFHERSERSRGIGNLLIAGASWQVSEAWRFTSEYEFSYLKASGGTDTSKVRHHHTIRQPFHQAKRTSSEIRFGVEFVF